MKKNGVILLLILPILFFSPCLTTKQTNLLREPEGSIPNYASVETIGEYTVKPGDELNVRISVPGESTQTESLYSLFSALYTDDNNDTKLRTLSVSPEGSIYFPYIGDIPVAGKTTLDIQTELEKRINKEILTEDGSLVHVSLANRFFSVIGESGVGRYDIPKEQLTIYQALSQSKDIRPYGDRSRVKVIRQTENGTAIREFDLRSADIVNSEFYYIQPNDVIYVQPLGRQFWGISSFSSIFAVITTISSLGIAIYNFAK